MRRVRAPWLLTCLLAAACGGQTADEIPPASEPSAPTADASRGGAITVGILGEPTTFLDWNARTPLDLEVADLLFRRLARPAAKPGTFEPDLAVSWEIDDRQRTIVFRLREDVSWEDGTRVTAADVLFSEQRAAEPRSSFSSYKRQIAAITAEGPFQVRFRFRRAYPEMLAHAVMGHVYPAHLLQQVPAAELARHPFQREPVGNGPFVLEQWARGRFLWFAARREDGQDSGPRANRIHLRSFRNYEEALRQMQSGVVGLMRVPTELRDRVRAIPSFAVRTVTTRGLFYLVWNTRRPPFDRAETRRTLGGLIDRRALAEQFSGLADAVASGPVPPGHPWYRPVAQARATAPDPAGRPPTIALLSLASDDHAPLARSIAQRWRAAGMTVQHAELDRAAYSSAIRGGEFDVVLRARSKTSDLHLPDAFGAAGGANAGGFHDETLQALLDDLGGDLDLDRQRERFQAAAARIAELEPWTFLIYRAEHLAVHEKLRGIDDHPSHLFAWADQWWTAR